MVREPGVSISTLVSVCEIYPEAFDRVKQAFSTLSNDSERKSYDARLVEAHRQAAGSGFERAHSGKGAGPVGRSAGGKPRAKPVPRGAGPKGRKARRG